MWKIELEKQPLEGSFPMHLAKIMVSEFTGSNNDEMPRLSPELASMVEVQHYLGRLRKQLDQIERDAQKYTSTRADLQTRTLPARWRREQPGRRTIKKNKQAARGEASSAKDQSPDRLLQGLTGRVLVSQSGVYTQSCGVKKNPGAPIKPLPTYLRVRGSGGLVNTSNHIQYLM